MKSQDFKIKINKHIYWSPSIRNKGRNL